MSDDKVILSPTQAKSLLSKDKNTHTFRDGGGIIIGADWDTKSIIEEIEGGKKCEIGGEGCRGMGHGLIIWTSDSDPLFVEVDEAKLKLVEAELTPR